MSLIIKHLSIIHTCCGRIRDTGEGHFGAADSALDNSAPCSFGAGHFGAVSYFFFSNNEEKTMKQAIPWMPLSANLKLESSILPRAKRATSRNKVATEKRIKKKVLAPNGPGAEISGAEMSSAETVALNRRHRNVPDPCLLPVCECSLYCVSRYIINYWYNFYNFYDPF